MHIEDFNYSDEHTGDEEPNPDVMICRPFHVVHMDTEVEVLPSAPEKPTTGEVYTEELSDEEWAIRIKTAWENMKEASASELHENCKK